MHRLLAALVVVPASLVAAALFDGPGGVAHARPEFAKKEGKECAYCHKSPKGGGPLNDTGEVYRKNKHSFPPEPKGFGPDGAFSSENNAKAFALLQQIVAIPHYPELFKRLGDLKPKEKRAAGAAAIATLEKDADAKGTELARTARDSVQGGKVPEAAEALIRVETEFKGREAAKDIGKLRADFAKLAGAADADKTAKLVEAQRVMWLDAQVRALESRKSEALKILGDLATKYPDGPFTADAKKKITELGGTVPSAPAPTPAMGG